VTRRALLAAAAFVAAIYVTWQHDPVRKAITFDNQVYYYIAEQVADGVLRSEQAEQLAAQVMKGTARAVYQLP